MPELIPQVMEFAEQCTEIQDRIQNGGNDFFLLFFSLLFHH